MKLRYDRWDWLVLIVAISTGFIIIHLQPIGKNYHNIPLLIFWVFYLLRRAIIEKQTKKKKKDA